MKKYQEIIKKIYLWQKDPYYSTYNFSQEELKLIADALETMQFLEVIFKERLSKEKSENYA